MIRLENLSFGYTEKSLYDGVNFIVSKGQKVGLVGPNGSGKSTLLKILTGKETSYKGKIVIIGSVAQVPQEVKHDPDLEAASKVKDYVDPNNNYSEHEILIMFSGLELELKLDSIPQKLSGGQKTKLALARALLSKPDTLLLDEPTNFMDSAGKRFVMDFLGDYKGTVIVISHDLELMDKKVDKVFAINPITRVVEEYKGNYSAYLKLKKEKEELLKRQIIVRKKHIKQMEKGLIKMQRFTSDKGVKRRVQQKRRIEKEKAELPDLPQEVKKIKIDLPTPAKLGEVPLKTIGLAKSYGDLKVLKNVDFIIIRGERIVLIGANGTGKSTFIKILMGVVSPDKGEVIGSDMLKVGYYSQEFESFDFDKSVIDTFCEKTKKDQGFARAFLGKYMFQGNKVFQSVGSLSGGEKTRLSIAIITGTDNNLLILDEPTTYLDVMSQRVILEALKSYTGTMIIVSHTPEFVKELTPNKAYIFPDEKMVLWDNDLLDKVEEL